MTSPTSQQEIQEWAGTYWQPSMVPMYRLSERRSAPRELLSARDVPREDWDGVPPKRWDAPELLQITRDQSPDIAAHSDSSSSSLNVGSDTSVTGAAPESMTPPVENIASR